ncbi:IS21 family transposase, partial [Mycobacterium tuberculosis]|nr:IS21 family transposase [Mycobacterium tuberculosis]
MLDEYMPKIEEWVERGNGKVRADIVHERLVAMGFTGTERTTRRAVAQVKAAWRA